MRFVTVALFLLLLALPPAVAPAQTIRVRWQVTDSLLTDTWDGMGEHYVYGVRLVGPSQTVLIRDITEPLPFVVGDSLIVGVRQVTAEAGRQFFRWGTRAATPRFYELPSDVWPFFTDLAISPDARFLAYVASGQGGTIHAAIRTWPQGAPVLRGPEHPDCECDIDQNHAHWVGPDSFEVALPGPGRSYTRISGSPNGRRLHVDTLRAEPQWH